MTPLMFQYVKLDQKGCEPSNPWPVAESAKCPELEIGNHSVKPCTIPRIIACKMSIMSEQPNYYL